MYGSLSPPGPKVVTDASAFGLNFVAPDFACTASAVTAAIRPQRVSSRPRTYRMPTDFRRFADDIDTRRQYDASSSMDPSFHPIVMTSAQLGGLPPGK
jgi:hypothetical protein